VSVWWGLVFWLGDGANRDSRCTPVSLDEGESSKRIALLPLAHLSISSKEFRLCDGYSEPLASVDRHRSKNAAQAAGFARVAVD
jgi:hypothetical protein